MSPSLADAHRWAIGIDVGTTNTKVVALALEDGLPVLATERTPTADDPRAIWADVRRAIGTVIETRRTRPVAVGIASMAESGCLLAGDDEPLSPLLRWDRAHVAGIGSGSASIDEEHRRTHFLRTGVRLAPKTTWSMLLAYRACEPERFRRARRWVCVADLVHLGLTGRHRTDATLAGRTGLYPLPSAAVDGEAPPPSTAELAPEIGIPAELFPVVTAATDPGLGPLAGVPVTVAGHDHAVAAWAVGMRAPGTVVDSVGTSEAVLRIAEVPVERERTLAQGMSVVRPIEGGAEAVIAGSPTAGELIRLWQEESGGTLPTTDQAIASLMADDSTARVELLSPYPRGRQAPFPDRRPRLVSDRGRSLGQVSGTTVLLALSLHAEWLLHEVGLLASPRRGGDSGAHEQILAGAALARNDAWAALKSALSPVPSRLVQHEEVVAAGAALLAAVRAEEAPADATVPLRRLPAADPRLADRVRGMLSPFIAQQLRQPPADGRP